MCMLVWNMLNNQRETNKAFMDTISTITLYFNWYVCKHLRFLVPPFSCLVWGQLKGKIWLCKRNKNTYYYIYSSIAEC